MEPTTLPVIQDPPDSTFLIILVTFVFFWTSIGYLFCPMLCLTFEFLDDEISLFSMAPEVALSKPYNETADTYSFAVLCWQMFSLDAPYEHIKTVAQLEKSVVRGGVRPKIDPSWGDSICRMLRESFVGNPNRPSMADNCERLRIEINRLSDEDIDEYLDESRRSRLSVND